MVYFIFWKYMKFFEQYIHKMVLRFFFLLSLCEYDNMTRMYLMMLYSIILWRYIAAILLWSVSYYFVFCVLGATREIGSALTRLCMRHKSIEEKLKSFNRLVLQYLNVDLLHLQLSGGQRPTKELLQRKKTLTTQNNSYNAKKLLQRKRTLTTQKNSYNAK